MFSYEAKKFRPMQSLFAILVQFIPIKVTQRERSEPVDEEEEEDNFS